ncbi:D-alanyl-D-alanine carboxypeptidase/D-alanyl-D-alanine endopeptidase [Amycolatopsis taiwanensis]|uniref:D-alanyl-D-alanine carboxypeptidase/D-alanyl-D-alanine-endopeptidase n=1 Tax=Amycolatopsis taiwanensis TaxID=342230 RepID=A0A9W6R3H9_9PSEU|nr:D-alanyl-D-alanine carboxypeptidase/D-alanyl-D-alanine-endopeptidase [Amycolatopsis taiwanensis]GLY68583.1 hypothetical protein Atai01_52020 [Amycolatopsis taiwanensis]
MPPHEQEPGEPLWPSDDSDTPGEGGKTAHLPVLEERDGPEKPDRPAEQETANLPVSSRLPEPGTVWVPRPARPASPPESQPRAQPQNRPAERPQPQPAGLPENRQTEHPQNRQTEHPENRQTEHPQNRQAEQETAYLPQSAESATMWVRPPARPEPQPPTQTRNAQTQNRPEQAPRPVFQSPQPPPVWPPRPAQPPQPPPSRPIPPASAAHAEPMRIEATAEVPAAIAATAEVIADEQAPPETSPPRRRRRGLILSGAALLLVVVLGVAAALPYVSNRLGLPWAPNVPKGDSPQPMPVNLALKAPNSSAPTPTNSGIAGAVAGPAGNPALGTLTGAVVDPATGTMLWDQNGTQPLTPASTTKILTMAAALLTLDHGQQLSTKVVAGSSPDTVILVAGGDPTLSALPAGQKSIYSGAAHLDDLVSQVKKATGGAVRKVQIDLSLYSGPQTAAGWAPGDAPSTFAAPITPGMLDGGMTDPANEHSPRIGDPAGKLLQEFARRLGASPAGTTTAAKTAKVLGEVRSAPLTELINTTIEISDDTLAEMLGRQTAIATGAPATFDGAAQAAMNVLSQNGFDITGMQLRDSSGISNLNKVPARLLAQLLGVAAAPDGTDQRTAKLRPLLEGLPVAGGSGTLDSRYHDAASSAGKGWVRAKTGTLDGVNTLAGVVLDVDGRVLSFALMSNGSDSTSGRPALDAVTAALRGCGCR